MRDTPSSGQRRQRGIAVITAMLVVAIATVLAVEMAWQTNLDVRRTAGLLSWDQAHELAYGAEDYAIELLEKKLEDQSGETAVYSAQDDEEACGGFQFALDQGGTMTGGVCDLEARFNLNNLVNTSGKPDKIMVAQFRRLLEAVSVLDENIDIGPADVNIIVESTIDWLDPDTTADFNGAEDDAYTSDPQPYLAANFWFTSVSEWRSVRGVTPEIYQAVSPFLAALPVPVKKPGTRKGSFTKLNVNTALLPVLMSLGDNVTEDNASQWMRDRLETPFENFEPFTGFMANEMEQYLAFSTEYFELKGFVSIGTTRLGMYSLLESDGQAVRPRLRQFDVVETVQDTAEPVEVQVDSEGADASQ